MKSLLSQSRGNAVSWVLRHDLTISVEETEYMEGAMSALLGNYRRYYRKYKVNEYERLLST